MAASQLPLDRVRLADDGEEDWQSLLKQQDAELQQIFQKEKGNFAAGSPEKGEAEPTLFEIRQHIDGIVNDAQLKDNVFGELEEIVEIGHYVDDNQAYLNSLEDMGNNTSDVQHHLESLDTTCEKCIQIESIDKITQLKPADHIRFRRSKLGLNLYNHHAIVINVNIESGYMVLVHFQKNGDRFQVIKQGQQFKRSDDIDRINYNLRPFTESQIIERAEIMAEIYEKNEQAEGYSLTGNNCEHKSNEIATGVRSSDQVDSVAKQIKSSLGWLLKCLLKLAVKLCKGMKHCIRGFANIAVIATFLIQIDHVVSLRHKLQQGLICSKCFDLENSKVLASLVFSLISIGVSLMFHTSWLYFGFMTVIAIALPFLASFLIKSVTSIVQPAANIPKVLVKSTSMVHIGDVITFTYVGLGHEGVVTDLRAVKNRSSNVIKLDLVHFNYPGIFGTRTVVKETFFFDVKSQNVSVYHFTGEKVFDNAEVVKRAKEEVQKQGFNMLSNRSSHLCRYCKTGSRELKTVPSKRIKDIKDIQPGDIINFFYYCFPHDAVVIHVEIPESIECQVVHYKYKGIFGTRCVAEETLTFKLEDQNLFVHDYCGHDIFPASEVVDRAKSKIGEEKFNTFTNRSSHVAKWCKVATVLKKRHSMKDKDIVPIVKKVEDQSKIIPFTDLARLRVDRCLSTYSKDELATEFEKLTGWNMEPVLPRKQRNMEHFRHLMHFTILEANLVGAPPIKRENVLFKNHALISKSLRPVIRKVRDQKEIISDSELARLTENRSLSSYSIEELSMEFEGLTGWRVEDVIPQTRQKKNLQNIRHLLHFAILEANLVGAPPLQNAITVVLKKGHSLIGKSLNLVISKVEAQGEPIPVGELARLETDVCLTTYSIEQLSSEFEKLTEWTVDIVMPLARKRKTLQNVIHLVHFTILEANIKGAPPAKAFNRSFKK